MADNPPEPPPKAKPPSPPGGQTGRLKVTSNRLPSALPGRTGKVVVMLSSVAKPTVSQQIVPPPKTTPVSGPTQPTAPPRVAMPQIATTSPLRPPPLPGKRVMPNATPLAPEQRNPSTTFVKLPPKTTTPSLPSFETKSPGKTETAKVAPALIPPKRPDTVSLPKIDAKESSPPAATPAPAEPPATPAPAASPTDTSSLATPPGGTRGELRRTGPIKLNIPTTAPVEQRESLFVQEPASPSAPPPGSRDKRSGPLPPIIPPAPPLVAPAVAPPLAVEPPITTAKSEPVLNPAPVSLQPSAGASAHPVHVAPPLADKAQEEPPAKLPPPHLPEAASSSGPELHKAPPLLEAEKTPAKPPAVPPPLPAAKPKVTTVSRATGPVKLDTTTKFFVPPSTDGKPALRPAVLPSRALRAPITDTPTPAPGAPSADKPEAATAKAGPAESTPPAAKVESAPKPDAAPKTEPAPSQLELKPSAMEWKVGYVPPGAVSEPATPPPVAPAPATPPAATPPPLEAKPPLKEKSSRSRLPRKKPR